MTTNTDARHSVAEVVTATALSPDAKAQLIEKLGQRVGGTVVLNEVVDPSVLGGIRITLAGQEFDGTLVTQLKNQWAPATGNLRDEQGRLIATVSVVQPLDEARVAELADKLSAKLGEAVVIDQKVDPQLIGGVKISVNGKLFDGSVKAQLSRLRTILVTGTSGGEA
ncbi:MAG: F0F1 ATP synthase subunit delta [Coriobacteriia bacterium]|nr:F0F1 ATP synthase subunit delta [Coriobacteriia bacterium]